MHIAIAIPCYCNNDIHHMLVFSLGDRHFQVLLPARSKIVDRIFPLNMMDWLSLIETDL